MAYNAQAFETWGQDQVRTVILLLKARFLQRAYLRRHLAAQRRGQPWHRTRPGHVFNLFT